MSKRVSKRVSNRVKAISSINPTSDATAFSLFSLNDDDDGDDEATPLLSMSAGKESFSGEEVLMRSPTIIICLHSYR